MIQERDASEEEMILEFLKAEYGRPLIDDADLSDDEKTAGGRGCWTRAGVIQAEALSSRIFRATCAGGIRS